MPQSVGSERQTRLRDCTTTSIMCRKELMFLIYSNLITCLTFTVLPSGDYLILFLSTGSMDSRRRGHKSAQVTGPVWTRPDTHAHPTMKEHYRVISGVPSAKYLERCRSRSRGAANGRGGFWLEKNILEGWPGSLPGAG